MTLTISSGHPALFWLGNLTSNPKLGVEQRDISEIPSCLPHVLHEAPVVCNLSYYSTILKHELFLEILPLRSLLLLLLLKSAQRRGHKVYSTIIVV